MAKVLQAFRITILSDEGMNVEFLNLAQFTIGRSQSCGLTIDSKGISREHLLLRAKGSEIWLVDKNSANGTFVNGSKISHGEPFQYHPGDQLKLGLSPFSLTLEIIYESEDSKFKAIKAEEEAKLQREEIDQYVKKVRKETEDQLQAQRCNVEEQLKKSKDVSENEIERRKKESVEAVDEMVKKAENGAKIMKMDAEKLASEIKYEAVLARDRAEIEAKDIERKIVESKGELTKIEQQKEPLKEERDNLLDLSRRAKTEFDQLKESVDKFKMDFAITEGEAKLKKSKIEIDIEESRERKQSIERNIGKLQIELERLTEDVARDKNKRIELEADISATAKELKNIERLVEEAKEGKEGTLRQMQELEINKKNLAKEIKEFEGDYQENCARLEKLKAEVHQEISELRISSQKERKVMLEQAVLEAEKVQNQIIEEVRELKRSANIEAQKIIEQSRHDATVYLDGNKKDALAYLERAHKQGEEFLIKAKQQATEETVLLRQQTQGQLDQEKNSFSEERADFEEKQRQLNRERDSLTQEKEQQIRFFEEQQQEQKNRLKQERKDITSELDRERKLLAEEYSDKEKKLQQKREKIIFEKEAQDKLLSEEQRSIKEAGRVARELADAQVEEIIKKAKVEAQKYINQGLQEKKLLQKELSEIKFRAEKEAQDLLAKGKHAQSLANSEAAKILETAKERSKHLETNIEDEIEEIRAQAEGEYAQRKKREELSIAEMRAHEIAMAKERHIEEEKKALARRKFEVKEIARNIDSILVSKINNILKSKKRVEQIDILRTEIKTIVTQILNHETPDGNEKLKDIMVLDPEIAKRQQKYWIKVGAACAVVLTIFLSRNLIGEFLNGMGNSLTNVQNANEKFLEDLRKNRPKFTPPQTAYFKKSYTDNILYTIDYVATELDSQYKKKWISQLNKYFVDKLYLGDNVIVTFVALETNLIKKLALMQSTIDPKGAQEGIKRLYKIERKTILELEKLTNGKKNLRSFRKFKKRFYENYTAERNLASEKRKQGA